MKKVIYILSLLLCGCATAPSTVMIGPGGQTYRCASYGYGAAGVSVAAKIHQSCVDDMKKLSYIEVPKVSLGIWFNEPISMPLTVKSVVENSPAENSGFLQGDQLLKIDNKQIHSFISFLSYLGQKQPGQRVAITVHRGGKNIVLMSILGSR